MTQAWKQQRYRLRYALGDKTLFAAQLPLKVRTYSLADILSGAATDQMPRQDLLKAGEAGFLERSRPVPALGTDSRPAGSLLQYVTQEYERYFIDLNLNKEDYLKRFSGKSRSTLLRKVKRFARESGGDIDWREYRTPNDLEAFFPIARDVSKLTYQERLLDAGLPEDDAFCQSMMDLAEQDSVRAYLLFLQGKAVAYLLCPIDRGTVIYAYLGYDPAVARLSPGTVLQWLALEGLFADERFTHFDFTEGEGEHKRFFSTDSRACADVLFLRPSLANRFRISGHRAVNKLSARVGQLLDRMGVKAKVRALLRRG